MRYAFEELKVLNLLAATSVVADLNGTGVSVEGYEDDAMVIVQTGLMTSTACSFAFNIQACTAAVGTYTTIATLTTGTAADGYKIASGAVSLKGTDRKFVRLQIDTTLTGGSVVSGIFAASLLVRPTIHASDINSGTLA